LFGQAENTYRGVFIEINFFTWAIDSNQFPCLFACSIIDYRSLNPMKPREKMKN